MKKSRFTDEQIAFALKQAETGTPVTEITRKMGVSEVKKLRQLEEENARLKRIVADLTLNKQMLQDVVSKKF